MDFLAVERTETLLASTVVMEAANRRIKTRRVAIEAVLISGGEHTHDFFLASPRIPIRRHRLQDRHRNRQSPFQGNIGIVGAG